MERRRRRRTNLLASKGYGMASQGEQGDRDLVNHFVLGFSPSFEGELELSNGMPAQGASVTVSKRALGERCACGRRLERIGLSDGVVGADGRQVLGPTRVSL